MSEDTTNTPNGVSRKEAKIEYVGSNEIDKLWKNYGKVEVHCIDPQFSDQIILAGEGNNASANSGDSHVVVENAKKMEMIKALNAGVLPLKVGSISEDKIKKYKTKAKEQAKRRKQNRENNKEAEKDKREIL